MKAVIEKSTGNALYLFSDTEVVQITEKKMLKPLKALDIKSTTHEVVSTSAPDLWVSGGALRWDGSQWSIVDQSAYGAAFERMKADRRASVVAEYWRRSEGGIVVDLGSGPIQVASDRTARQEVREAVETLTDDGGALLITTRSGEILTLDLTAATALRNALRAHEKACLANDAALQTAIRDAATVAEVAAIDITSGWPE